MGVVRLTGTIVVDDHVTLGEAWIVGGRLAFDRPTLAGDITTVTGFVLPGLVDVHCHVGLDSGGAVPDDLALKQALADRDAGTLLIRDAGSPSDTRWLDSVTEAPRMLRAGRFIARPKRYLRGYARELDSVGDLPQAVRDEAAKGDGWVKLIADWIDRDAGDLTPLWPQEVLTEAIAAAHTAGARVTAHTFATETLDPLFSAGIDCIEHGTGMTAAHIAEAAARGIPVVPTLLQVGAFAGYAAQGADKFPAYARRMLAMHERRYEHVMNMYDAGVSLLLGTDAGGTIGHGSLPLEAAELATAGVPARDVVAMASYRARHFLGAEGISEGASADVVVYAADPRVDIGVLAHPTHIFLRGMRVA